MKCYEVLAVFGPVWTGFFFLDMVIGVSEIYSLIPVLMILNFIQGYSFLCHFDMLLWLFGVFKFIQILPYYHLEITVPVGWALNINN